MDKRIKLNRRVTGIVMLVMVLMTLMDACTHKEEVQMATDPTLVINLKWNQAYADETKDKVETGLLWVFTFLGADMPSGSYSLSKKWNGNTIQIDLSKIGFNQTALQALAKLLPILKQSEEYRKWNAIDIGRFIMLTLNSSNHYYAITGVSTSFANVRVNRFFDPMKVAITHSTVSLTNRLIEVPDSNIKSVLNLAFISQECGGSIPDGTQNPYEFETTELMANGQFRFGIYDTTGKLMVASNTLNTISGKPAKCLWCHEINIQTPHTTQTDVPGYYGADMFGHIVSSNTFFLKDYRNTLRSDIDFNKTQDHTYAELLYISFMEPTAERIAVEWNLPLDQVKAKVFGLATHSNPEFSYSSVMYNRRDIDSLSTFSVTKVPYSAREFSDYEPDLIR